MAITFEDDLTAAAGGGADGVGIVYTPPSNYWVASGSIGHGLPGSTTLKTVVTGTIYFTPFYNGASQNYTDIGIPIGTTAAGNVNMGIYASSNGLPTGDPITNSTSGSVATSSNTFASYTFSSPITLSTVGLYYLAFTLSDTNSIPGWQSSGYEGNLGRGLGHAATPDSTPYDNNSIGYFYQAFSYDTTLPTVSSLTSGVCTGNQDVIMFLQVE